MRLDRVDMRKQSTDVVRYDVDPAGVDLHKQSTDAVWYDVDLARVGNDVDPGGVGMQKQSTDVVSNAVDPAGADMHKQSTDVVSNDVDPAGVGNDVDPGGYGSACTTIIIQPAQSRSSAENHWRANSSENLTMPNNSKANNDQLQGLAMKSLKTERTSNARQGLAVDEPFEGLRNYTFDIKADNFRYTNKESSTDIHFNSLDNSAMQNQQGGYYPWTDPSKRCPSDLIQKDTTPGSEEKNGALHPPTQEEDVTTRGSAVCSSNKLGPVSGSSSGEEGCHVAFNWIQDTDRNPAFGLTVEEELKLYILKVLLY